MPVPYRRASSPSRPPPNCGPTRRTRTRLPSYDVLDGILRAYVEENRSPAEIAAAQNVPLELVREIVNKVDRNEYKRQQAAPGLKVTSKAFGIGRRFPIAQRFLRMKAKAGALALLLVLLVSAQPVPRERVGPLAGGGSLLATGGASGPPGSSCRSTPSRWRALSPLTASTCWC